MSATGVASLAMYPLPALREATDAMWRSIRSHLGQGPQTLDWSATVPDVWEHPDLFVGQTCGWPLVSRLADSVEVVGSFDYDVPEAHDGTYCSVLASPHERTLADLRADDGSVVAVNGFESLSGWISMQHAWGGRPAQMVETGSHLESVRSLREGRADVASIDAVTWQLVADSDPSRLEGLHVVGSGPRVPCLPIVAGRRYADEVPALRAALAAFVSDADVADARRQLRIRGFVPRGLDDYLSVRSLVA